MLFHYHHVKRKRFKELQKIQELLVIFVIIIKKNSVQIMDWYF